ncbi:cysteine dioxygenase [Roseateles toxinivorans]|uniref:Putative metal-dependent enzyme (Double-stranded beta helix superfamily) n=1 Tax=Roseateles toxinivorans TaxID=270368 RepID=A0A4V3CT71_9BURK|nr:cysteine dioxygenase [Roseateles toxinivorans]TDP64014.1 putative metal-dependent enzyme (double-stranded beta helix superfamily) [Roseateles toxinivorans]
MSTITAPPSSQLHRLRDFVTALARVLDEQPDEARILAEGGTLLAALVAQDDWLPEAYARPDAQHYRQYLLHADSAERFSVVSFVWGPGQRTPIHDHTVWGLIGVLRGAEIAQAYARSEQGQFLPQGPAQRLQAGQVEAVSPRIGDVHQVSNALADQTSISIHVYGANIGAVRRSTYMPDGTAKPFISGYSNTQLPNIWDRSKESQ